MMSFKKVPTNKNMEKNGIFSYINLRSSSLVHVDVLHLLLFFSSTEKQELESQISHMLDVRHDLFTKSVSTAFCRTLLLSVHQLFCLSQAGFFFLPNFQCLWELLKITCWLMQQHGSLVCVWTTITQRNMRYQVFVSQAVLVRRIIKTMEYCQFYP